VTDRETPRAEIDAHFADGPLPPTAPVRCFSAQDRHRTTPLMSHSWQMNVPQSWHG
jgi:hypothetical protein